MRKRTVAGNWKMNMTPSGAVELAKMLLPLVDTKEAEVIFAVPAIDIIPVIETVKGSNVKVAAQNMYHEEKGAFTGEISPLMLIGAGVTHVILGHSERRGYFGETNADINKKMLSAIAHAITPIMCCGETLDQREKGVTESFIKEQVRAGFEGICAADAARCVIAYEPIWAIGTGRTATPDQAQEICAMIREYIGSLYDEETAKAVRILYGGSVNAGNARELFEMPDIDGGLVGGASLKEDFGKIVIPE